VAKQEEKPKDPFDKIKVGDIDVSIGPQEIEEEVNIMGAGAKEPGEYTKTEWPKPCKRYRLVFESYNASMEETYYWFLNHVQQDQAYASVEKLIDTMTAAEHSSIWGLQMQKLGLQQDKVSQYLAIIGKMTKELFQIVREIRILKERLAHYELSKEGNRAADTALKGYWVDLVEGGGKNPASIYGLAQQVGFITLPDLFFNTVVGNGDDVDKEIERQAGDFNLKVKEVLRRKLQQYVLWRKHTEEELRSRHTFTLRYLRQHWNSIKLYMSWAKPYLRNIKRLQTEERHRNDPEVISTMESATMEIEILAKKPPIKGHHPVVLMHFMYRVRPAMLFQSEYQKGPVHVGRITVTLRGYGWTPDQVEAYKQYRKDEDFELLGYVDGSIEAAMDALGDDLVKYLEEAEQKAGLKKKEAPKPADMKMPTGGTIFEPFTALWGGVREVGSLFKTPAPDKKKPGSGDPKPAQGAASGAIYQCYKNYKASHGMIKW